MKLLAIASLAALLATTAHAKPDLIAKATARKLEILGKRAPARLDPVTDAAIRAKYRIHLPY